MACDASNTSSLCIVSGMAFEAKIARGEGIRNVYGLNPQKLTQDIEAAIAGGATSLLSFGTAAGLSPALVAGSIVIARQVKSASDSFHANVRWGSELLRLMPEAVAGDMAGVDHPLKTAEEKIALHTSTGVLAADMESHHMARIAHRHNLPFAVLRVVLDGADCTLPPAALASTTADGGINYSGLIRSLMTQPQQLPAMMRLGSHHKKAKKALLRCGQLLNGSRFGLVHLGS
jgi:hopanoid-associated phosphorylase